MLLLLLLLLELLLLLLLVLLLLLLLIGAFNLSCTVPTVSVADLNTCTRGRMMRLRCRGKGCQCTQELA